MPRLQQIIVPQSDANADVVRVAAPGNLSGQEGRSGIEDAVGHDPAPAPAPEEQRATMASAAEGNGFIDPELWRAFASGSAAGARVFEVVDEAERSGADVTQSLFDAGLIPDANSAGRPIHASMAIAQAMAGSIVPEPYPLPPPGPSRLTQLTGHLSGLFGEAEDQALLDETFDDDDRPVDARRPDQLMCPTCKAVHLPVEGSERISIAAGEKDTEGGGTGENRGAAQGGGNERAVLTTRDLGLDDTSDDESDSVANDDPTAWENAPTATNDSVFETETASLPPMEDVEEGVGEGGGGGEGERVAEVAAARAENDDDSEVGSQTTQPFPSVKLGEEDADVSGEDADADGASSGHPSMPTLDDIVDGGNANVAVAASNDVQGNEEEPNDNEESVASRMANNRAETERVIDMACIDRWFEAQRERGREGGRPDNNAERPGDGNANNNGNERRLAPTNPLTHLRNYGALRAYTKASCPVCLEECEPSIVLPCGHCLCEEDFHRMGGYLASDKERLKALVEPPTSQEWRAAAAARRSTARTQPTSRRGRDGIPSSVNVPSSNTTSRS